AARAAGVRHEGVDQRVQEDRRARVLDARTGREVRVGQRTVSESAPGFADAPAAAGASAVPAIRLEGISKFYPGVRALEDVDLVALQAEVHALVGENGAGKSTLLKI